VKRLAVFLDGTWNTLNNNTNVWRLRSLTAETADQRVYYSQGVGTRRGEGARGGITGWGIDDEIIEAYTWLIETSMTATRYSSSASAVAPILRAACPA